MQTSKADDADAPASGRRPRLARAMRGVGALPLLARLRAALRGDLRILAYHRVRERVEPEGFRFDPDLISASAEAFAEQLRIVRRRFAPLRFDELLDRLDRGRSLPRRAVLITFDDGYDDNARIAFPLLRDAGLSAMFFVSTGHIDSGRPYAYDWLAYMLCTTAAPRLRAPELGIDWALPAALDARRALLRRLLDRIKTLDAEAQHALIARLESEWGMPADAGHADCRPMSWNELRAMRDGGMEIGSHGVHHRMLAKLPQAQMREEVFGSARRIAEELGTAPQVISYPVGGHDAYDAATLAAVREAGYRLGCSYLAGAQPVAAARAAGDARFGLRRVPVERDTDAAWFESMLALPELFCYRSRGRVG